MNKQKHLQMLCLCVNFNIYYIFKDRFMSSKRLCKSTDKKLFGVCAGIAEYFDIDPTIVRVVWILLVLCAGTGVLAYIIAALVMPNN